MTTLILVLLICVRTAADILFKTAMHRLDFNSTADIIPNLKKALLSPFIWLGGFFGAANFILWLVSLKFFDLSYAYPFLSISYITIILSGAVIFKEHLDRYKLIGILFISIGAGNLFLN